MAEYSQEYAKIKGLKHYDFSYIKILQRLENGQYEARICEGLGIYGVHRKNNIYYFVVTYEGDLAEYSLFLKSFKDITK